MFDPYRKWLGIPAGERPPTHYQLLGISPDENDPDVIKAAVVRQSAYVRNFQAGTYAAEATRLLNEIGEAKVCLLDPSRRANYDRELRARRAATSGVVSPDAQAQRPNRPNQAAGIYGPDLAGSRLPGARVSSAASQSLPMSPARPPASMGQSVAPPDLPASQRQTRRAAHAPPSLDHDPIWQTVERAAGPDHAAARTLLPSGRPRAALPVWLWSLPIAAAGLLAISLVVHFTARRPRQLAQTASAGGAAPATDASITTPSSSAPSSTAGQAPNAGPLRPDESARMGDRVPNTAGAAGDPSASTARFDAGNHFGSKGTPAPASAAAPPNSSPPSGLRPNGAPIPRGSNGAPEQPRSPSAYRPLPAARPAWHGGSTFAIPWKQTGHQPIYAQAHGPFVALDQRVYSLIDGSLVAETRSEVPPQLLQALSSDGKYWARGDDDGVDVCRTDSGEVVSQLGGKHAGVQLLFLAFGGAERLLTITRNRGEHYLQSWDLASRKLRKDVQLEDFGRQTTVSDDGRFLATNIVSSGIVVYDIQKSPSKGRAKVAARIGLRESNDVGFLLVDGLQFSRDGAELIALYDRGEQLKGWTPAGNPLFDYSKGFFHEWAWTFESPAVECEPNGRGWLLWDRLFVDRNEHRVTWLLDEESPHSGHTSRNRFIDGDRLAVCLGRRESRELVDAMIPWKKIEESLAARQRADAPAWLGPHHPVSLKIDLDQTLGDAPRDEIERDLSGLLIDRLAADGINVLRGRPAVLAIQYAERSDAAQAIATPLPQGGAIAGQTRGRTFASGALELYIDGSPRPFWASRFSVEAKGDEGASIRSALYAALGTRLARLAVPYFISKDEDVLVSLPVVIRP